MKQFVVSELQLNALRLELPSSIVDDLMKFPLEGELLKKKNLDLGHIYAFESGLGEGKRQEREKMKPLVDAMQEFVNRCDRGEIRSVYTYSKFKGLLETLKGAT